MTEPKKLPENLAEIIIGAEYVETDETYTVKELQAALTELGVEYRSTDNKDALVWRLVDAQSGTKEPSKAEEPKAAAEPAAAEPKQPEPKQPEPIKTEPVPEVKDTKPKKEKIRVYNNGSYNLYEPHSRTLFYAYKEAVIEITPSIRKEQVLRNIEQINATRGKVLVIR
ncbi:hypothetical protein [Psychrobacter sanguinis]|uniref:hypothetical protein n=1 Tax=Psychrobacter sanguinis TaxID=861445 RepID=UPI001919B338|nr:hypothetical protein [Psychrobacter sanguinis]MCC3344527.1 hypothetical protein [Psychrobacter sanguinis]